VSDIKDQMEITEEPKRIITTDEIRSMAEEINPGDVAKEIMSWLIANVEQYIDNNEKIFRLYLAVDCKEKMPESMKLQELYMAIPPPKDDNDVNGAVEEAELLDILDDVCEEVHEVINTDEQGIKDLFKRLIFFFEMTGFSQAVGPLVQKLDGSVTINELSFDSVPMEMQVKQPVMKMVDGDWVQTGEKRVVKEVTLPAGFAIELELDYWKSQQTPSMY
jgi:hypothetical protein